VRSPADVSPAERTDLAWQRTGLGLLSVSGLLGARALHSRAPALLVVAGVAALIGLAVLGVLAPLRFGQLQRRRAASEDVSAPRLIAAVTLAVVAVAVAAGVGVLTPR
jgi:putative membrane protein